ncbi:MAG: (Fe-S)-binding protein [Candidatus Jordarchaeum sp.]|uniref:(Fe-S)-binding protein n=1 Tax=Candidatus Jordarchaeum sp. TaxID=2823881 RepID=UPI00404B09D0
MGTNEEEKRKAMEDWEKLKAAEKQSLQDYRTELAMCNICAFCRIRCPVYQQVKWESVTPRGKMQILRNVVKGWIKPTPEVARRIFSCTTCQICNDQCDAEVNPFNILKVARKEFTAQGLGPLSAEKKMDRRIVEYKNPYKEPQEDRFNWLEVEVPKTADTLLYFGCVTAYRYGETGRAIVELLKKAGYDFTITPDEGCCGMHPYWDGEMKLSVDIAKENIEIFKKTGAKKIVTACAGCYSTFKNAYPELVDNFDFELVHFSELLLELIKNGKLKLKKTNPMKVTYHDPCHLGRHSGVFDAPREVIKSIPGVELVEMEHSGRDSQCCGGGGGYFTEFPEDAVEIAEKRVREAEETGADALVTTCPLCKTNLDLAIKRLDSNLKLYDLSDLVLEHLA